MVEVIGSTRLEIQQGISENELEQFFNMVSRLEENIAYLQSK